MVDLLYLRFRSFVKRRKTTDTFQTNDDVLTVGDAVLKGLWDWYRREKSKKKKVKRQENFLRYFPKATWGCIVEKIIYFTSCQTSILQYDPPITPSQKTFFKTFPPLFLSSNLIISHQVELLWEVFPEKK